MLEFVIISGLGKIAVDKISDALISNYGEKRGYVYRKYSCSEEKNVGKKVTSLLLDFVPVLNIFIATAEIIGTCYFLISPTTKKDKMAFGNLENTTTGIKDCYDYYDRLLEGLEEAMKIDGATPNVVKEEMKKAEGEVYSNKVKLSDKQRRKLDAMSDAELWLRDIELENGLSSKERGELFPQYTQDFMNTNDNAKPKAIEKTLKLVNKR